MKVIDDRLKDGFCLEFGSLTLEERFKVYQYLVECFIEEDTISTWENFNQYEHHTFFGLDKYGDYLHCDELSEFNNNLITYEQFLEYSGVGEVEPKSEEPPCEVESPEGKKPSQLYIDFEFHVHCSEVTIAKDAGMKDMVIDWKEDKVLTSSDLEKLNMTVNKIKAALEVLK